MDDIGIFEAKTKFPSLCDQVVRSGAPILVRRRGQPLVIVSPAETSIERGGKGILDHWNDWQTTHRDPVDGDFPEVWKARDDKLESPLED